MTRRRLRPKKAGTSANPIPPPQQTIFAPEKMRTLRSKPEKCEHRGGVEVGQAN